MDEPFDIPVTYEGEELAFNARLLQSKFSYQFEVDVHGSNVLFEPDEEGSYRATLDASQIETKKINVSLIQAIATAIETIVK